jgi:hypothetical protein
MSDHTNSHISRRGLELLALAVLVAVVAAVAAWLVNAGSASAAGSGAGGTAPTGRFAPVQQSGDGTAPDAGRSDRGDCPERGGSGSGDGSGDTGASGSAAVPSYGTEL